MPTLIDFRRRIRSVKNTQQITRAMKFVAAAKLRRAQENALSARPYARQLIRVLQSAMCRMENPQHPLLERREEKRVLVLVLSGDKGLCGAFNTNVLRKTMEFLREHKGKGQEVSVIPIGKRGRDALRKRGARIAVEYVNILSKLDYKIVREISSRASELYVSGEVDAVYAIFNEFKSVMTQRLVAERILPIDAAAIQDAEAGSVQVDYIYEQPPAEILGTLLPRYVETQVHRSMLESAAAEHAARMTAMDAATNNAKELISKLTLHMNKVRQAAITKEIIEVVSGASSTA
ncbi:MAG: ATP synthase F1 subunit gamma [Acidobacteria bacterium]|nr:ATP synthase F1 subunit gamma [Acidobacteriota bacterium]